MRNLWSLLPKTHYPMKRRNFCLWGGKNETIWLFYLKNRCTSFYLIKLYDLRCQKPSEDWLKSCQNVFYFQHFLKLCPLTETHLYLWNDLLESLINKCTTIHLFEDNPVFDSGLIFLSPLTLKAVIFSFRFNSFLKQRFYFCYLTFRRKSIKFYRYVDNVSETNSYYCSTIFKKFGRDLTIPEALATSKFLKSYQLLLHPHWTEQNPHIHFEYAYKTLQ